VTGPGAGTETRLARLRGRALPVRHNARTIAALAGNPGCARRAVLDAAGASLTREAGLPANAGPACNDNYPES